MPGANRSRDTACFLPLVYLIGACPSCNPGRVRTPQMPAFFVIRRSQCRATLDSSLAKIPKVPKDSPFPRHLLERLEVVSPLGTMELTAEFQTNVVQSFPEGGSNQIYQGQEARDKIRWLETSVIKEATENKVTWHCHNPTLPP